MHAEHKVMAGVSGWRTAGGSPENEGVGEVMKRMEIKAATLESDVYTLGSPPSRAHRSDLQGHTVDLANKPQDPLLPKPWTGHLPPCTLGRSEWRTRL